MMNKTSKHIMGLLFCVFLVSAAYDVRLGSIRQDQSYDGSTEIHYNVHNRGSERINNARITFWMPELDHYERLKAFSMRPDKKYSSSVTPDLSGIEPGEYLARVRVSGSHASSSRWIWVDVG